MTAQDTPTLPRHGGGRLTPLSLFAYALALATIAIDQISKAWIVGSVHLATRGSIFVLPIFSLTFVPNRGVSYGLLTAHGNLGRWALVAFSLVVAAALAVWAARASRWLAAGAVGLVMGGAVGNAIDRARIGYVVDFLDFSGLHFPWVFNVADSAISVGVVLLLLDSLLTPRRPEPA